MGNLYETKDGVRYRVLDKPVKDPEDKQVCSNDLLYFRLAKYFRIQRFSDTNHIGIGDIRLTIGQQEHILKMVAEETGCEYRGI